MSQLSRGQKQKLADLTPITQLRVQMQASGPMTFDFPCFGVDASDKLSDDRFFVFYNQKRAPSDAIIQSGDGQFDFDLNRLPATIKKLVFVATIDGAGTMSGLQSGAFSLRAGGNEVARFNFKGADFGLEKAIVVAEIYWKDVWRLAAVGQGFAGGLSAILQHFGGQETAPMPPPTPPRIPTPRQVVPPPAAPPLPPALPRQPPLPLPPAIPRPLAPRANAPSCNDCGKTLSLIERGVNSLSGDGRCAACDRAWKHAQQLQTQQQANAHITMRQQVIQRILGGDLPIVVPADAGIVLKLGEICHYVAPAQRFEERVTSTARLNHGATARIRICRGVTYRVGAAQGKIIPKTGMVQIDTGRLLLTNQRYIFDGQTKNLSVPLAKLVSFEPFADGLELNPENKKTQQYKIHDGEMAAIILSTILNF